MSLLVFRDLVKNVGAKLIGIFLPRKCIGCSDILPDYNDCNNQKSPLCFNCEQKLHYITRPTCKKCCEKLPYDLMHNLLCMNCLYNNWSFDQIISCVSYNRKSLDIAMQLKYKGIGAYYIANRIVSTDGNFWVQNNIDFIIPMPLFWKRLFKRGFNQSEIICLELEKLTQIEARLDILCRVKNTKSQGALGQRERMKNVFDAFIIPDHLKSVIKGRHIVLVDDIVTTGATAESAAHALKVCGVKTVTVVCWAKRLQDYSIS